MQPLSLGRVVLVLLPALFDGHDERDRLRAARVTRAWNDNCANVTVDLDGSNDAKTAEHVDLLRKAGFDVDLDAKVACLSSATFGDGVAQLRWPPRVETTKPATPPAFVGLYETSTSTPPSPEVK
jgi:hypothetical protein